MSLLLNSGASFVNLPPRPPGRQSDPSSAGFVPPTSSHSLTLVVVSPAHTPFHSLGLWVRFSHHSSPGMPELPIGTSNATEMQCVRHLRTNIQMNCTTKKQTNHTESRVRSCLRRGAGRSSPSSGHELRLRSRTRTRRRFHLRWRNHPLR